MVLVAIGALWSWEAGGYGYLGEEGRLAAGTLPALAGAVLALCGVAVCLSALLRARTSGRGATREEPAGKEESGQSARPPMDARLRRVLLLCGLLVCLLTAPLLGFTLSFALLTFFVVKVLEGRGLLLAVGCAGAIFGFGYLIFETLLQVPLP